MIKYLVQDSLVTVPSCTVVIDSVYSIWVKLAVTVVLPFIITVQGAVPLQPPPDQPVKVQPGSTIPMVSTTGVP